MTNSTNVAAPKVVRPKALVGTWALRSLRQYRADGKTAEPMGSDPHGYITFGPGYNALSVIAEDLGLDKWWDRV